MFNKLRWPNLPGAQTSGTRREFLLERGQFRRVLVDANVHVTAVSRVYLLFSKPEINGLFRRQVAEHEFEEILCHRLHTVEVGVAGVVGKRGVCLCYRFDSAGKFVMRRRLLLFRLEYGHDSEESGFHRPLRPHVLNVVLRLDDSDRHRYGHASTRFDRLLASLLANRRSPEASGLSVQTRFECRELPPHPPAGAVRLFADDEGVSVGAVAAGD